MSVLALFGPAASTKRIRSGSVERSAPVPASTSKVRSEAGASRASVARYGQPREKRRVRGEPAGYELSEEPDALRLACLPLCEKPKRSVHVQIGARRPRQQGVGIANEARQCRHPEPLPYGR